MLNARVAPEQPHQQEAEEVSVRVRYFLLPRFPRSRRSFDDAPFSPDAALYSRNAFDAFDAIDAIDTIAGSEYLSCTYDTTVYASFARSSLASAYLAFASANIFCCMASASSGVICSPFFFFFSARSSLPSSFISSIAALTVST